MYISGMEHKTFLFFDCECANCYEGKGKICSFGYALTDDELNIIESADIVMNPRAEFDWFLFSRKNRIKLAYSREYFRSCPDFPSYYRDIKKLLTTGNRYTAGFSVGNDIGFMNSECERFSLPYISLRAFDIEKFLEDRFGQRKKLSEWAEWLGTETGDITTHKSEDDAVMTARILREMTRRTGLSASEIMENGKKFFISGEQVLRQAEERRRRKELTEQIRRMYNRKCPMPEKDTFGGKKFELSRKILRNPDQALELARRIYSRGGILCEGLNGPGALIVPENGLSSSARKRIEERGIEIIPAADFLKIL